MNKKKDKIIEIKPFDRSRIPPRQNLLLLTLIWLICLFNLIGSKLKITKVGRGSKAAEFTLCP